jgi:hypothetical protein
MAIKKSLVALVMSGIFCFSSSYSYADFCNQEKVQQHCSKIKSNACKSECGCKKISLLKENEYVIPDDVIDEYSNFYYGLFGWVGKYINIDVFTLVDKQDKGVNQLFRKNLASLGYNDSEINYFIKILGKVENIIVSDYAMENEIFSFEQVLNHERTHYYFFKLSKKEREIAHKAYISLTKDIDLFDKSKSTIKVVGFGNILEDIVASEYEFLPYLICGGIDPSIFPKIKKEYPEFYQIYLKLKKQAEVKGDNQRCQ